MSEAALRLETEKVIPCPVCKAPLIFVEGEIDISRQLSFCCHSARCRGKRRYIRRDELKKIIDNFNHSSV